MGVSFTVNASSTFIKDNLTMILQMMKILSICEKDGAGAATKLLIKNKSIREIFHSNEVVCNNIREDVILVSAESTMNEQ